MALNPFRSVRRQADAGWTLVPSTPRDIDAVRRKCRRLVVRRAAMSAGAAAVPIPGLDVAADITLLMRLIEEINTEFGLTPEQIEHLQPKAKVIVYRAIVGVGSTVVGKVVTRDLVGLLLKKAGLKTAAKYGAKLVPVAGQVASAVIGFAAFRVIGYQHVEACARVAEELSAAEIDAGR
jgi:uncharacterized protein (DUF697 family)